MSILTIVFLVTYVIGVLITGGYFIQELIWYYHADKAAKARGDFHRQLKVRTIINSLLVPFIPFVNLLLTYEFVTDVLVRKFDNFLNKPLIK